MGEVIMFPELMYTEERYRAELKRHMVRAGWFTSEEEVNDEMLKFVCFGFQLCYDAGQKMGRNNG